DFFTDSPLFMLTAFPVGLSLYVISGYLLLVTDIGFSFKKMLAALLFFVIAALLFRLLAKGREKDKESLFKWSPYSKKMIVTGICIFVLTALFSVSGILSVSLSNDSMYYFNLYPQALVNYGHLRREFNVMLTDVGLGAAVIGTLPHLFSFNESFGILTFFNLNFLCIFFYALFSCAYKSAQDRKKSLITALFGLLFLMSQMPFIIISKWVMANMYFMEYMFICYYLLSGLSDKRKSGKKGMMTDKDIIPVVFMVTAMSTLRMEGTIMAILLLFIVSMLELSNGMLSFALILPQFVLQLLYDIRIFVRMDINAPYTFLTKSKAVIGLSALLLSFVYMLFVRGRVKLFDRHMGKLITGGLVLVNAVLYFKDRELFTDNLIVFSKNLMNRSGWGTFPVAVLSVCIIIVFCTLIDKMPIKPKITDVFVLEYLLLTLAVSFARENTLQEGVGDSGNRVLLQIVPLVVFALYEHVTEMVFVNNDHISKEPSEN
ncbi:MAG: hypothetical protein K6G22_04270, partial [Lachnospiraceae bacterium]|nr:hypothetical protein [Lachnospiraceae bacterium]